MVNWNLLSNDMSNRIYHRRVLFQEPMSKHTTFRVGGPASILVMADGEETARTAIEMAHEVGIQPFFLGNGSNLLVADAGYEGIVIKPTLGLQCAEFWDTRIWVGSGTLLSKLANWAQENGKSGLEPLSGIPGTVGGATVMNAGAYGGEMAQVVTEVIFMNEKGELVHFSNEECQFSYRHSIFADHPEWFILWVQVAVEPGDKEVIRAKMAELAEKRRSKQPLDLPSAGSTFKRPAPLPDGTPVYAAALIEQAGCKGLRVGGAQVSEKHAGFIVNTGGATCADILALIGEVKRRVRDHSGVELEPEVKILGA